MLWRYSSLTVLLATLVGCTTDRSTSRPPADPLAAFQARAAQYHSVITIPTFETMPEAVQATVEKTIAQGNAALDAIVRNAGGTVTD